MKEEKYIDLDGQELKKITYNDRYFDFEYYNSNNQLHRLDGPAKGWMECLGEFGEAFWYKNGKYHRIGGPACCGFLVKNNNLYINGKIVKSYYICG